MIKLGDIVYVRTQVTLLYNLIAWGVLHTAICQILFSQRWFSRPFAKFSYHQSFSSYGILFWLIVLLIGIKFFCWQFFRHVKEANKAICLEVHFLQYIFIWECINSGLDYWNGGIVEWWTGGFLFLFSLFVMLYLLCRFGRSLLHLLCSWIPRF